FRVTAPLDPESTGDTLEMRATHDVITIRGLRVEHGTPLLVPALADDGRRLLPRVPMPETAARTRAQIALFAPGVIDARAKKGVYPVKISDELKAKTDKVLAAKST
ncbi:hypothetical protein, partial [Planctopirus hydrillae]|uniref:hypothetical protein n=1 Tax=Planctopirus hydrillae TaxID=1841610 RepID=UPI0013F4BDFC